MNNAIPELDKKGYRKFAVSSGLIVIVLFGLLLPFLFSFRYPVWPWAVAAILSAWVLVAPMSIRPLYRSWMRFGLIMNWINTRLILGIVFYGLLLPIGLLFKIIGKDPMHRRFDKKATSYRTENSDIANSSIEHPY